MSVTNQALKYGILSAKDLALLSDAFDTACRQRLVDDHSLEAEIIAEEIVAAFRHGVRDKDELIRAAGASSRIG
jgi:hypothetical protein